MKKWLVLLYFFTSFLMIADIEIAKKYYASRDYEKAYQIFHNLAANGNPEAQMYVAIFTYKNLIKDNKSPQPLIWLEKSAQQKYPDAMGLLAIFYLNDKKYDEGMKLLEEAANLDSGLAQYNLGCIYEYGLWGKMRNHEQASFWLNKALKHEMTRVKASLLLGVICYRKSKNSQDMKKAVKYLQDAANANDPTASFILFQIYFWGEDGVSRDLKQARVFFLSALKNKNTDALVLAGVSAKNNSNLKLADLYFEQAKIQKGDISAIIKTYESIIKDKNFGKLMDTE